MLTGKCDTDLLLTLCVSKSSRKNDQLSKDKDRRNSLLHALVTAYVRRTLAEDDNFVMQKLASTLALLYQNMGTEWQQPTRHILASVINGDFVSPSDLPRMESLLEMLSSRPPKQIASVFLLISTMSEDVNAKASGSTIQQHLSHDSEDALALVVYVLISYCRRFINSKLPSDIAPTTLSKPDAESLCVLALNALSHWAVMLKLQESITSSENTKYASSLAILGLQACLEMLNHDALGHLPLQALVTMQTISPKLVSKANPDLITDLRRYPFAQNWLKALTGGDFSPESLVFGELIEAILLDVDVTQPDYLRSGRYNGILELLLLLLRCEGTAVVEDEICGTMLEWANSIVEGFSDWDPDPVAERALSHFTQQVCEACLHKVKYPPEEFSNSSRSWDKDDNAAFREFRIDVEDFLQSAFSLLGKPLIDAIAISVRKEPPESDWTDFEASLCCLSAFSDTINSDADAYSDVVASVIGAHYFQRVLQSAETPGIAQKTCILFLSGMTSYFKHHSSLPQILNFLFSSLQQSSSATVASRAIYSLCDSQRSSLTEALPGFMASLGTIQQLRGMNRHRIYGAVAAIVQALPNEEDKVQPLREILNMVRRSAEQQDLPQQDHEQRVQANTDLLQTLAAVGRGLRDPDDKADRADDTSDNTSFWTSGIGSLVQKEVLELYLLIMREVSGMESYDLIEASCEFIKSGFPEKHPSPFKFDTATSARLVTDSVSLGSPNIDAVMSMASGLLASVDRADFQQFLICLIEVVLSGIHDLLTSKDSVAKIRDSAYPAATLDFMSRMFPRTHVRTLLEFEGVQQALGLCIELALVLLNQADPLPRRSAAQFIGAFTELSKPGKITDSAAKRNVEVVADAFNAKIIALLLQLVSGDCARSEIDLLSDQIRRYVIAQPMVFKSISRELVKDENAVLPQKALQATSLEDRQRFIAQVDGVRGSGRTNDIVKEWWGKCRGDKYTYIS